MIKNKVCEVVRIADQNSLLTGLKTELVTELQQEILNLIKELVLQMRLAHDISWREPKEFEDVGSAYRQFGIADFRAFLRPLRELFLVFK